MRRSLPRSVFCTLISLTASASAQGVAPQVTINSIAQDVQIDGSVTGLTAAQNQTACVVVYIKTDKWYVHPYANAGPGQSFATVDSTGQWSLATVKRDFPANAVAAVLFDNTQKCQNSPARTGAVTGIAGALAFRVYTSGQPLAGGNANWYGAL